MIDDDRTRRAPAPCWDRFGLTKLRARILLLGVFCLCFARAELAPAQTDPDELARRHFEAGAAYYEQADYASALREFEQAYRLSAHPEILLNVATVHERLGQLREAIRTLDEYLRIAPDAPGKGTLLIRRDNLQKRIDEQDARGGPSPAPTTTPAAAPVPASPAPVAPAPPASVVEEPPPNRVPSYVLFSVAGVSAAGALLTGVVASAEYDSAKDECSPHCSDHEISNARTMATVSTVLTGVAVASVTLGTVFWFTLTSSPAGEGANLDGNDRALPAASSAALGLDVAPERVSLDLRWRFQ